MINEVMYGLGSKSSVIRELFSYGLERKKVVGADKVYDFSLGNPSIPAPHQVKDAIAKLLEEPAEVLHGYSPASGDPGVKETLAQGLVSIPGCMTPTEICAADEAGADFIKLFPAGTLGIKYCKDIYAPIHHVKFLATVGVTEETFKQYLEIGFAGAGISSQLVDKKLRDAGNYAELTERAKRFVAIAKSFS